jgi:2-phosphosulfolactate phosphatase
VRIDVAFTPAEVRGAVGRRVVVVIDVLRATSTIIHALVNGARSVLPVGSVEDAVRTSDQLGRDNVLLCGERDAEKISGFHLGNSPLEFTSERIADKTLVMTTTNGTTALLAAGGATAVYVGALINASAVARRVAESGSDALLLCAGKEGMFALEDAMCAGRIARHIALLAGPVTGNDALHAALLMARRGPTRRVLSRTAAGRRIVEIGNGEDITFCAQEDLYDVVPVLDEHRIRL